MCSIPLQRGSSVPGKIFICLQSVTIKKIFFDIRSINIYMRLYITHTHTHTLAGINIHSFI